MDGNKKKNHKFLNNEKFKYNSLLHALDNYGFTSNQNIDQDELRLFLNNKSPSGYFDSILCEKLFKFIKINENENSSISIPEFIKGFLLFEKDLKRKGEIYQIKLIKEKEIYNDILKQCIVYKTEKLNEEGFCENAKISGEITDIDIQHKLKGIKEIVIIVIFNNMREELHFKIGEENSNIKKSFEFKPTSRKDYFEFIMKGINDKNHEFNIGNKIFSLNDISSHEKYLVQITIPELDDPDKIAAYINLTIVLYMSYRHYYESLRKKEEKKLHKYQTLMDKSYEYLEIIDDIYENISQNDYSGFNTEREIKKIPLNYHFYRKSIRFNSPIIQNKRISYNFYKSGYNNSIINNNIRHYSPIVQRKENYNISEIKNFNNIKRIQQEYSPPPNTERPNINISNYLNEININKEIKQRRENTNLINHHIKAQSDLNHISQNQSPESYRNKEIHTAYNKLVQNISSPIYNDIRQINYQTYLKQKDTINNLKEVKQEKIENFSNSKLNDEQQIKLIKGINLNNSSNSTTTTKNITTTTKLIKNENEEQVEINANKNTNVNQNNNITEIQRASVHQIVGEISKQKTITTETKILKPVIKDVINMKHIIKNAIITHIVNKELVEEEKTLPIQYLPEKVNELIYTNNIITLPIISADKKVIYKNNEPIINELKNNEEEKKVINNINNISLGNIIVNNNNINNTKVIKLDNNSNVFIRPNKPNNINHSLNNKFYLNNKSNSYNEFVKENILNNNLHKSNQSNQGKNSQVQTIRIPIDKSQVAHYKFNY